MRKNKLKNYFIFLTVFGALASLIIFILLYYKKIDMAFSTLFILIGAIITTAWTNYLSKETEIEKDHESKEKTLKRIKNTLLYNKMVCKSNLIRIKSDEMRIDIFLLTSRIWENLYKNIHYEESEYDKNLQIMAISIFTNEINKIIQLREDYIVSIKYKSDSIFKSVDDQQMGIVNEYNRLLLKKLENLIKEIEEYTNYELIFK